MGFSRKEHWSGLPFPSPGDLPGPGIEPMSLALAGGFFTTVGFSFSLVGKESACNAGNTEDAGSILGSGRSPGGGHGNSL